jgi:monoamine oxidase
MTAGVQGQFPSFSILLDGRSFRLRRVRAAGGTILLPRALDPWRHADARLPLGRNEKLFLEIIGDSAFVPETRVLGNLRDRGTGVYHIRPCGWSVIECFLGDQGPG